MPRRKNSKQREKKTVHFCQVVTVHQLNDQQGRDIRSGRHWMQCALDRHRFAQRIAVVGQLLEPHLKNKLRTINSDDL